MSKLIYEDKVPNNDKDFFISEVKRYSKSLGIDPNWLMAVMYFESAKTFSPSIQNPYTKATGLIQFMPSTARELGTTIEELKTLTGPQQLYYVFRYYERYKGRIKSYIDLYLTTFFPLAVGKSLDFVLETSRLPASLIAEQNPVFDTNNDKKVTVREITDVMINKIPDSWKSLFGKKKYCSDCGRSLL